MPGLMPTVLVVEDDKPTADVVSMLLQAEGCVVKHVLNGQHCLEYVNFEKPDLIILDIMMPVMDGYTTATHLAANPETRGIPIIIFSARSEQMVDVFQMSANVVDYVQKPFELDDLRGRVRKILNARLPPVP